MMRMFVALWLGVALLGSGCATLPATQGVTPAAQRPLLDTPPANEAQARARINTELGTAYFEVGRFDVALDEARTALRHDPEYAPAFHLMGLVYMFVEDTAAARENFLRALRIAPNDPDFNNSYGWFLCTQGEELDGLQRLALAARNPYYRHPTRPYTNAGLCHLRLGDDEAAAEQFRRALALDGVNAQALYHLAAIAYRHGDYRAAREHLVKLHQQREPTAESAWLGLRTERRLGNREAEASYAAQLRGRFNDSGEHRQMIQGNFE
ncbi:MAG TPA: type IV pilus biogenesis/stability protein PilW [Rhodocyclaceae bacterium]|nr:type IV pilus biogenesis/stability protein PilW [Rhodocyclaceae bacterium]